MASEYERISQENLEEYGRNRTGWREDLLVRTRPSATVLSCCAPRAPPAAHAERDQSARRAARRGLRPRPPRLRLLQHRPRPHRPLDARPLGGSPPTPRSRSGGRPSPTPASPPRSSTASPSAPTSSRPAANPIACGSPPPRREVVPRRADHGHGGGARTDHHGGARSGCHSHLRDQGHRLAGHRDRRRLRLHLGGAARHPAQPVCEVDLAPRPPRRCRPRCPRLAPGDRDDRHSTDPSSALAGAEGSDRLAELPRWRTASSRAHTSQ